VLVLPLVLGHRGGLSLVITAHNLCVGLQRRLGTRQCAELPSLRLFGCAAVFSHALGQATLKSDGTGKRAREWLLAVLQRLADGDTDCDAVGGLTARSRFFPSSRQSQLHEFG